MLVKSLGTDGNTVISAAACGVVRLAAITAPVSLAGPYHTGTIVVSVGPQLLYRLYRPSYNNRDFGVRLAFLFRANEKPQFPTVSIFVALYVLLLRRLVTVVSLAQARHCT